MHPLLYFNFTKNPKNNAVYKACGFAFLFSFCNCYFKKLQFLYFLANSDLDRNSICR